MSHRLHGPGIVDGPQYSEVHLPDVHAQQHANSKVLDSPQLTPTSAWPRPQRSAPNGPLCRIRVPK